MGIMSLGGIVPLSGIVPWGIVSSVVPPGRPGMGAGTLIPSCLVGWRIPVVRMGMVHVGTHGLFLLRCWSLSVILLRLDRLGRFCTKLERSTSIGTCVIGGCIVGYYIVGLFGIGYNGIGCNSIGCNGIAVAVIAIAGTGNVAVAGGVAAFVAATDIEPRMKPIQKTFKSGFKGNGDRQTAVVAVAVVTGIAVASVAITAGVVAVAIATVLAGRAIRELVRFNGLPIAPLCCLERESIIGYHIRKMLSQLLHATGLIKLADRAFNVRECCCSTLAFDR